MRPSIYVAARTLFAAAATSLNPRMSMGRKCDYLVVGAGASGMAFVDTLLLHSESPVSVVMVDKREQPGGHWNDAYEYATLHQPARNYGVESAKLEDLALSNDERRATKAEVLAYYRSVLASWKSKGHEVEFVGGSSFDFQTGAYTQTGQSAPVTVDVAKKVVDARYTANDIPLHVPPRFAYDADKLDVIPPNELAARGTAGSAAQRHYVVLGAGKTGQDTMLYLRSVLGVPLERLLWVMPSAPWITCRDPPEPLKQNTCMEFLSVALEAHAESGSPAGAAGSAELLQRGFEALEARGNLYRLDPEVGSRPTKFMDATLNQVEVEVLQRCAPCMVRGRGRVASIADDGKLTFADGSTLALPWTTADPGASGGEAGAGTATTFVHCTAGAFNFGSSAAEARRPIFSDERRITIQELFQFPGFCFNGAAIAWIECQRSLSLAQKNALCEMPPAGDASAPPAPLGPVAGEVGPLHAGHPLCVSLRNLRRWYGTEGMGEWLHSLRLFSLTMNGFSLEDGRALAERNHAALVAAGVETE